MNRERLASYAARLGNSLWFLPTLMTVLSAGLAGVTLALDRRHADAIAQAGMFFDAGAEGARGVLSTIAGSIITVTGVIFSVTVVALQLASSQFTPRLLRSFLADRASQVVLGTFIATFTYSLLVLRSVRADADDIASFVPAMSVTIAVLLALLSIGSLIFFVNHIARSMQIETILGRVTHDVLRRVDALFPDDLGEPADLPHEVSWRTPTEAPCVVRSRRSGYLQSVEEERLLVLLEERDLLLEMQRPIGAFLREGDALALVWPTEIGRQVESRVADSFQVGSERTLLQDVERGIIELTDIALRALSPSINDPTTAVSAIDRLTEVLSALGRRRFPDPIRSGADRRPRILAIRPSFGEIVRLAYGQLRLFGAAQPVVALALLESLNRISAGMPERRLRSVREEVTELLEAGRREIRSRLDLEHLDRIGREVLAEMAVGTEAAEQMNPR